MDKTFKILLVIVLLLIGLNGYLLTVKPKYVSTEKLNPIVRLVADNGATFCTGTVISDTVILTAAHCILQETMFGLAVRADDIGVRTDNNVDLKVLAHPILSRISPQMDQAQLSGDFRAFKHAPFIGDITRLVRIGYKGNSFTACGYPLGGHLYCNTMYYKDIAVFFWSMKGVLIPGMSGGPVFFDDSVVAVNSAMLDNSAIVSPIYNVDGKK